jgi:ABC-2 type transport system permease protein
MSVFARQLGYEIWKLFARQRTYFGFAAFLGIEILILELLHLPGSRHMFNHPLRQYGIDLNLSHYMGGLTAAYLMVSQTVMVLGSIYIALVCGDIVSKEVEDGTMRMILSRPVTRVRILLLKYATCIIYTWVLVLFIVGSSLGIGMLDRGVGGLIVWSSVENIFGYFEPGEGFYRFVIATGLLCLVTLTLSTIGFMFSCFDMKPASATVLTLTVYFIDNVLGNVPFFEDLHKYFLSRNMNVWLRAFQDNIPWPQIWNSIFYLATFNLIFLALGAVYFYRRDFKS